MLRKLIKYDIKWINRLLYIYYAITIILALLTRISSCFTSSFIGNTIYLVLRGCMISAFVTVIINCIIRIWVRFKTNIYKDEAYLTHTLPVDKNTLYNSKILSSGISILTSLLVILVCFVVAFLDKNIIEYLKQIFSNFDSAFVFIFLIIIAILEFSYMMYCGLIGILIGHKSNNKRNLKSTIVGIGLYFIIQILILIIIYLMGFLNNDINSLFKSSMDVVNISMFKTLVIIVSIIYLVFISGMYFVGKKILNEGVNVD